MTATSNTRVSSFKRLLSPQDLREQHQLPPEVAEAICGYRTEIAEILSGNDKRLMVVLGPCSIHDTKAGLEYAQRLADLKSKVKDQYLIIMRVYFEKPRTTIGWKGLINDPHLDGTRDIDTGLSMARSFMLEVSKLGLPIATEFLDPIVPQYISDLVSWAAIGARTTESQTHREMASGLSMPVGFKNATDGGLQVAIDAMISASHSHAFLGIDGGGVTSIVETAGNPDGHIILRGGGGVPNYSKEDIGRAKAKLKQPASSRGIMVDCSHGNSNKDYSKQSEVFRHVVDQHRNGESAINGLMLESNLNPGKQALILDKLEYGVSITDGCISWEDTERLLLEKA